jgi:hypothetical protein
VTTFLSYKQPTVDAISTHSFSRDDGAVVAVVDFDHGYHGVARFHVDDASVARQLLTAAAAALHILNPDLAQEAVAKLVADLLDTAFPDDPGLEGIIRAGQAIDISHVAGGTDVTWPQDAAPDTAPEARCPEGCGCRLGTDDADRRECGCDGPCTGTAAPDTAQPDDIPLPPQCSRCQASSSVVPMVLEDGDWHCHNSAACGRRAQDRAKASAR